MDGKLTGEGLSETDRVLRTLLGHDFFVLPDGDAALHFDERKLEHKG